MNHLEIEVYSHGVHPQGHGKASEIFSNQTLITLNALMA